MRSGMTPVLLRPWQVLPLLLALLICATTIEGSCEAGWTDLSGNCYFFVAQNQSWPAAREWCITHNAELVDINSLLENGQVVSLSIGRGGTASFWIGLNDRQNYGTYSWSVGKNISYTNWRSGEPNNPLDEDCVEMDSSGFWNDQLCSLQQSFFCKKPDSIVNPTIIPPGGSYPINVDAKKCGGWYSYNNFCYQYFSSQVTYTVAQKACYAQGAYLLDILSANELGYIKAFAYSKRSALTNFYLGLNDRLSEKTFVWDDGTTQGIPLGSTTNWGTGEPNNYRHLEDCVEMLKYPSYKWNDISCTTKRSYICKRSSSSMNPDGTWSPLPAPKLTQCPNQYSMYTHPSGAIYCYGFKGLVSGQRQNWLTAVRACQRAGPGFDLASIHDHYEMNKIISLMKSNYARFRTYTYWFGLNDRSREGGYIYSDSTPTDYIHWGRYQPNNLRGRQDCVATYNRLGQWNDDYCSSKNAYICKVTIKPRPLPAGGMPTITDKYCNAGWHQYGPYCYLVRTGSTDLGSHAQALGNCAKYGANLTSIHSMAEHGYLMSMIGLSNASARVHIGINDISFEGEFKWTDKTRVDFTNWGYNQPNDWQNSQDCTELDHNSGYWNDINCQSNGKRGYVCKRIRDQPLKPTSSDTSHCATGWQWFNNYCYQIPNKTLSAYDAQTYCAGITNRKGLAGSLATIRSRYDNFFITSLMFSQKPVQKAYFIGLNDMQTEGVYSWISGLPVTYSNWSPNEPNDWYHSEDCTEIFSKNSRWNDRNCSWPEPFICMMPDDTQATLPTVKPPVSGSATANCPSGWVKNPSNNICYGFFGSIHKYTIQMTSPLITPRTWTDANAHCQSMQAQLVSIHDNATNNFLISQTQQNNMGWYSFWTGLNDRNQEGGYSWFDGSSLQFTSWATQEPNDWRGGEDCVEVMLAQARAGWKFHWNDQSCTSKRPYVCAYPAGAAYTAPTLLPAKLPPGAKVMPSCPAGWTTSPTSCFMAVTSASLTYSSAELKCQAMGANVNLANGVVPHLASVHTPADHIVLAQMAQTALAQVGMNGTNFWIGLQDRTKENNFTWTDHSIVDYLAWSAGQPNNWANSQDCVEMRLDQGYLWNDLACSARRRYVCSFSRISSPSTQPTLPPAAQIFSCNPGWQQLGLSCYKYFQSPRLHYNHAYLNCSQQGGDLYIANSKEEDQFVMGSVASGSSYIWIGLSDTDREGYWRWADGTYLHYTNWGPSQPNNYNNEDCVALHSEDDRWYDRDCGEPHGYICEVPLFAMNYTAGSSNHHHVGKGLSGGGIAGVVIGIIVIVAILVIVVYFGVIRRRGTSGGMNLGGRGGFSSAANSALNGGDDDDDAMLVAE